MRVLISGFEPFGNDDVNPTRDLVRSIGSSPEIAMALRQSVIDLHAVILPVAFGDAFAKLERECEIYKPDVVLAFGVAGGRSAKLEIERIGINIADAPIADNVGEQPIDQVLEESGPAARFATLPIKRLLAALEKAVVPASVSNSAGTFVCNELLYRALGAELGGAKQVGFIHVPHFPHQKTAKPGLTMTLEQLQAGLVAILKEISSEIGRAE